MDSSNGSKYINTYYVNSWGQKVYNKAIEIRDAKVFLNDYVGGLNIDDAYIRPDNIIVDDPSMGRIYGTDCRENIVSLNGCFYRQRGIVYNGGNFTLPDMSGYKNLNDIGNMYFGTQITYLSSDLLSLYDGRNDNDPENILQWSDFIGTRELKIAKDALKHISYRISNLSQMELTIYDPADNSTILNTDASAPDESKYLNIVEILCPKLKEGSEDEYEPFNRIRSFSSFNVNSQQFIDYTTLFEMCPNVEELNGFLRGDLRRAKMDGMLHSCKKLRVISESISHNGNIDDLSYSIDLYDFFDWTAETSFGITQLFTSSSSEPSFAVKKIITQEHFATIMATLHNYQNIHQLANIFSYCHIDGYDPNYEIQLSGDMPNVRNINCLFYRCRSVSENVPLRIRRSLFKHLPNVTMMENTFNGVWFDHMPSYDFFCKRTLSPKREEIYVSNTDELPEQVNTPTNAYLYSVNYSHTIQSMLGCFSNAKFYGCKCWFDVNDDFDNEMDSNVYLKPYDDYIKYSDGSDCAHTVYFKKESGVWIRYELTQSKAYTDTLDNYTHYSDKINSAIGEWEIDNHNLNRDLNTFNNKRNGVPYDTELMSDIHISPTFCCLPPDIFYGCNYNCDLKSVFEDTNIIGVLPQHLIVDCYEGKLNDMLKNVNILPNLIYHHDPMTEDNGNYVSLIDHIPVDESLVNKPNSETDDIRYNMSGNATVLFRNSNGELRRRRAIVSAHMNGSEDLLEDPTVKDYYKSQFVYVPQGYVNNRNLDNAFNFRYNLPDQVDLSRQALNNQYGIIWPGDSGGINESPDNSPQLWPYYTQYFFTVDESIVWNKVYYMNEPFITENDDCDFSDLDSAVPPRRVFSDADKNVNNKWWPTDYLIDKTNWNQKTNGIFNVFLNLCGQRDARTGKVTDCGCLIGKAKRNSPKLGAFLTGPLVAFLNGRVFDLETDAGEFTDLNGSQKIIQYSLGLARNIIFPTYHLTTSNLELASKHILDWDGTERTIFYKFMFPLDSYEDYDRVFGIGSKTVNTSIKYIVT